MNDRVTLLTEAKGRLDRLIVLHASQSRNYSMVGAATDGPARLEDVREMRPGVSRPRELRRACL